MDGWSPIEFTYDLQLFRLSIRAYFSMVHVKLYREGVLVYREGFPIDLWQHNHYSHEFWVRIDQKSYCINIRFGKTDYSSLSYSVVVNNTLVAGEEPKKLELITDMADLQKKEKNPFIISFILFSPLFAILISDYINHSMKKPLDYLIIWILTLTISQTIEMFFQKAAQLFKRLIAIINRFGVE
ncbi:hypothetical protein [Gracilinema caldarium]|uniref:Uncharacterized protein n=1 Tax=Gracilinema caldarium (strain ATCC 51460 / DSM 7334 / H1) TaxID=744872 RepID=F8F0A3_GRAC1|nr:hypothetical protein [Gracilinema caldarium]AEJ18967.1 hypothetical protein Spica_0813 [Gracilinema caldarium DSM 7334]